MEVPTAITFTGRLYGETDLLAVAHAYQQATGHHLQAAADGQGDGRERAEEGVSP